MNDMNMLVLCSIAEILEERGFKAQYPSASRSDFRVRRNPHLVSDSNLFSVGELGYDLFKIYYGDGVIYVSWAWSSLLLKRFLLEDPLVWEGLIIFLNGCDATGRNPKMN